tara:strand:- start:1399 stop:1560 length:162 start_codon:yes stop_codon:yes gene_type:complete
MTKDSDLSTVERPIARSCGQVWVTGMLSILVHDFRGSLLIVRMQDFFNHQKLI